MPLWKIKKTQRVLLVVVVIIAVELLMYCLPFKHKSNFLVHTHFGKISTTIKDNIHQPHSLLLPNTTTRIVIIGAGPTGLGAAYRLSQYCVLDCKTNVTIVEMEAEAGGLASSYRDKNGFLWDNGGHVVFSHYPYFDKVLKEAVKDWNKRSRASYAFMMGSSGKRKFIPYPVQNNIHVMDAKEQQMSLKGLEQVVAKMPTKNLNVKPHNFDDWLVRNFGEGLSNVFMRKYNRKVWTVDPKEMNADWVGERVAVPDVESIKLKMSQSNLSDVKNAKDSKWGPNQVFEFPATGGTGGIWKKVSKLIPSSWFLFGHKVANINSNDKVLELVQEGIGSSYLKYDYLISTTPLDTMLNMITGDSDSKLLEMNEMGNKLVYSHTHVIGVGLKGQAPDSLSDKSWVYFPDSDSPFYRVTVFSNYADDNVPTPGKVWSLMCEAAEPKHVADESKWSETYLIKETVQALVSYGFVSQKQVISTYHRRLKHGYPVPFVDREQYLSAIQPWLESKGIYSRGRFGGWRYEVGNQDHSLMQGVEVADRILFGIPEETYPNPPLVNSMKASDRSFPDYEIVVAHYNEDLSWLHPYADHCHVYHKGDDTIRNDTIRNDFKQWELLPNVGREGHTYLYHIIKNYHRLADVTLFVQGSIKEHVGLVSSNVTQYLDGAKKTGFYTFNKGRFSNWNRISHIGKWLTMFKNGDIRPSKLTIGEFWDNVFGTPHPGQTFVSYSAVFSVSRSRILSRPKCFYERIISFLNDHINPEEGHYVERFWPSFFNLKFIVKCPTH